MGRPKNKFKPAPLNLTVLEQTIAHLDSLVPTGLYGNNHTEVAKTLLLDRLRQEILARQQEEAKKASH